MLTPSHGLAGELCGMRQPSPRGQRYYGAMTAGATGGLEYSLRWGCVANTAYNKTKEPPAWGLPVL